ncbi:MAG: 5-formyltetrahydrofolate cyclo-ligase [Rickettsiales bacterium]|nr:5-formyltetrahydrofolate cyclo-ligase [Rickettsiales bacterium]
MPSKQELRQVFKDKRNSLSKEEVQIKSSAINNNFITNLLPKIYQKNSKAIFSIYLSSGNEVATEEISQYFISNDINFSYPKIIKLNFPLEFILFEKNQEFSKNNYFPKILEPNKGQAISPDIIILPLLAFDSKLSRLGMGGGFFDRTIEFLRKEKNIITIGLAYDFQGSDSIIPIEKTDQKLDFIVTETNIFS